jgi:hypothetical protein
VYVFNDSIIKMMIMHKAHDAKYSGHFGVTKTLKGVERLFWWPNLRKEVTYHVTTCSMCQRNKAVHPKPAGMLQPLPIPARPWDAVSFDFIVQLPVTQKGHNAIVVFVDRLKKMVHIRPTTSNVSAKGLPIFGVTMSFGITEREKKLFQTATPGSHPNFGLKPASF